MTMSTVSGVLVYLLFQIILSRLGAREIRGVLRLRNPIVVKRKITRIREKFSTEHLEF